MKKLLFLLLVPLVLSACETKEPSGNTDNSESGYSVTFKNVSKYYSYDLSFKYMDTRYKSKLEPGAVYWFGSKKGAAIEYTFTQIDGVPNEGSYSGKKYSYSNMVTADRDLYLASKTATLRFVNNDSHRYKILINGGFPYKEFILNSNESIDLELDMAYYHIDAKQLDYIFYPTDYIDDILLDGDKSIEFK